MIDFENESGEKLNITRFGAVGLLFVGYDRRHQAFLESGLYHCYFGTIEKHSIAPMTWKNVSVMGGRRRWQ